MDHTFCPGAKILRQPHPEFYTCPQCGGEVEIWTDELKADCPACRKTVYKDSGMSCLEWCKYGSECVGESIYRKYWQTKAVGIKYRLLSQLGSSPEFNCQNEIRMKKALEYAELILKKETADWHIVIPAVILLSTGMAGQNTGASDQAKKILHKLGLEMDDVSRILKIIAGDSALKINNDQNYAVVTDAYALTEFREKVRKNAPENQDRWIKNEFVTGEGRKMAMTLTAGNTISG
ncbi:MAG: hypothetical protein JW969_05905 [Spirochaetales bacterium]|nr:hypothetical protein [Spirochaetales bacterium]